MTHCYRNAFREVLERSQPPSSGLKELDDIIYGNRELLEYLTGHNRESDTYGLGIPKRSEEPDLQQPQQSTLENSFAGDQNAYILELQTLRDPAAHFDGCEALQLSIARHIAASFNIHGTSSKEPSQFESIDEYIEGIYNIITARKLLLNEGFCSNGLTILIRNETRPHVASATTICMSSLTYHYCSLKAAKDTWNIELDSTSPPSDMLCRLESWTEKQCANLKIPYPSE